MASVISAAVLAFLAKLEGKSPVQPLNATSHWLEGERAKERTGIDAAHTGTGALTHYAACIFWASLFEALRSRDNAARSRNIVRDAAAVSATAALVDYGIVPRRLSPGWEGPLPPTSVAVGFVGLFAGLVLGGLLNSSTASTSTR